jgi:hypothetical protein
MQFLVKKLILFLKIICFSYKSFLAPLIFPLKWAIEQISTMFQCQAICRKEKRKKEAV